MVGVAPWARFCDQLLGRCNPDYDGCLYLSFRGCSQPGTSMVGCIQLSHLSGFTEIFSNKGRKGNSVL